jgi:phytoene dehydrogenase-like protein
MDEIYKETNTREITEGEDFSSFFMSCTSLKDPSSFDGRHYTFEVVTFIDYNSFNAFNGEGDYHGEDYTALKEKIINKLMNNVEKVLPNAKQHIVQVELGTPKTNQFYIHSTNGNVYGTEKKLTQIGPFSFKHKTEIENLFLCGASTLSHGVGGATHSGVEAAAAILHCQKDDLLKEDSSQSIRIFDAENAAEWPDFVNEKRAYKKRRLAVETNTNLL